MAADNEEETPTSTAAPKTTTPPEDKEKGEKNGSDKTTTPSPGPAENDKAVPPPPPAAAATTTATTDVVEYDDFGLPIRRSGQIQYDNAEPEPEVGNKQERGGGTQGQNGGQKEEGDRPNGVLRGTSSNGSRSKGEGGAESSSEDEDFKDAVAAPARAQEPPPELPKTETKTGESVNEGHHAVDGRDGSAVSGGKADPTMPEAGDATKGTSKSAETKPAPSLENTDKTDGERKGPELESKPDDFKPADLAATELRRDSIQAPDTGFNGVSEYSHQQMTLKKQEEEDEDEGWQTMPAFAPYDMYDDDNRLIAREYNGDDEDQTYSYAGIGGAGKGYTRVLVDDDAESVTSMDDNTNYLFKNAPGTSMVDEDDPRDAVSQMQATKDLLTEGQKIAYVGLVRIELSQMVKDMEKIPLTRSTKKAVQMAGEATKMWAQKVMIRLYSHMDISSAEQIMIEQLSEHGVISSDLTPQLMANARVKNPMAEKKGSMSTSRPSSIVSPRPPSSAGFPSPRRYSEDPPPESPPAYDKHEGEELPAVRTPSQLPSTEKLDIDIRWTILCDLFLVLIADSIYDARSRVLFERVGKSLEIDWIDICRFERKVTEALEMQQQAERENWDEGEHMEVRRKLALKKRYMVMGLATVGGGLVIGLSAGLLAPVIGAGLAAGFTTIGVAGTSSFLGGAAASAIITSGAAVSGSVIGVRAANRRTGAVKTFEYRPLHNNKRVNLIVTISGWMTGKVDDVRLPFSTVDPVMGDIYSVLWEPEMLTSMGDTINILATEALTQGLQQVLGSTILVSLMAALQLPVVLTKLSYLIDNPWSVSLDRAWSAGLILADSLIERNLGTRPITLVGYSLGSRVIFACLLELARKGAFGLIQNVYMFGSPIVVKEDEILKVRTVVSGRFVNGYHRNDWILGYLFRLTNGGIRRVAGLAPIEGIPGIENVDTSELVAGHMDYRRAMPRLMRECGWLVDSDDFTEIEDPDPEKHNERQRELINEIEEARKELEKEGNAGNRKSGAFGGFFSRKKKSQKAEWEVYEDAKNAAAANGAAASSKTEDKEGNNHGVLFDVDAMRAELATTQAEDTLQVRELQSTLPPMKIPSPGLSVSPRGSLGQFSRSEYATHSSSHTSLDYGHGFADHDDGMHMTFDTGFDDTPRPQQRSQTLAATESSLATTSRPEAKTSQTMPNINAAASNPWADPDDDDFGREKEEISMTFA